MYLVAIAWLYVAVMMAIAEATHSQGTVLGAIITLLLYGVLPLSLVMYVMGTPLRRRRRLQQERDEVQTASRRADVANQTGAAEPPHAG